MSHIQVHFLALELQLKAQNLDAKPHSTSGNHCIPYTACSNCTTELLYCKDTCTCLIQYSLPSWSFSFTAIKSTVYQSHEKENMCINLTHFRIKTSILQ